MADMVDRRFNRRPLRDRFEEKFTPEPMSGCWLWTGSIDRKGYGAIGRHSGNSGRAHRASWEIYKGEIPSGLFVCHKCDTPSCVNPDHLFLGTNQDNLDDAMEKGRMTGPKNQHKGERSHLSKLTDNDVREIKLRRERGVDLATRFNVSKCTISAILHGRNWRHI